MKKHLALVLALVMVLTSFSFVSAAPDFSDMNGQPSAEAVARLELLNVLKGYPDGTFRPEGEITRAEFAAVAVRISGLEGAAQSAQGTITAFSDVPAHHWASGYVGIAASTGIVNGIGNGLFAPEAPVKYEEAVTMLVRALGYEPEAQSKGGYPYGYLIVAEDIDLLDGLRGSLGVNATRGLVAMLTDNALEIPMMVSVGFGDNIRWVVSGTERTDPVYLIEKMGFEPVEGRVTSFSTSRKTVTLAGEGTFDVMDSFDYLETEGVEIKAWVDKDDLVVAYVLQETVYYDAVAYDDDNDIELITLDDVFEVDEDATLSLNGETVRFSNLSTFNADFAKVVINDEGDVIWAKGYDFDEFIVVEEVDGTEIIAFDDFNEADLDDYDIMKDGKTIAVEDIVEGDVVFLNNNKEFAVVYNSTESGIVDRAYENSFRMDGTVYYISDLGAVYLEDGEMGDVDNDVLEEFVDEAADIEIFFDFYGDVVLMSGDKGTAKTSTFGLYLEADAKTYTDARTSKIYLPLDGVNSEGASVSFDAEVKTTNDFFKNSTLTYGTKDAGSGKTWVDEGKVIKYTIDEDGDITKIKEVERVLESTDDFKITDRFADKYRLKSSTVFFLLDEDGDLDEVFTLADADEYFEEVTKFDVYSDLGVYADYIVVIDSDAAVDTEEVGVIARIRAMANGDDWELTINIEGKTPVFVVDKTDDVIGTIAKGDIVSFMINDTMDEITKVQRYTEASNYEDLIGNVASGVFKLDRSLGNRQFRLDNATTGTIYELDSAVILDATGTGTASTISFSAIDDGDTVNVYYEGNPSTGKVFVRYLVVVEEGTVTPPVVETGVVTYINEAKTAMAIDGTTYYANAQTIVKDKNGAIVGIGSFTPIATGDQVEIKDNVATIKFTAAELAAAKAVADAKAALTLGDTSAVTTNLTLPTAPSGVSFDWVSSDPTVLTDAGVVNRPSYTEGDKTVTLTATITSITVTTIKDTKVFTVVVKAIDPTNAELALEAVNEATTVAEMRAAIEDTNLGLDLISYSSLIGAQKDLVAQSVLTNRPAAGFANVEAVQAALNAAL